MLELWTVYDSPIDFPGGYVARKWLLDQPTNELLEDKTLDGLRGKRPPTPPQGGSVRAWSGG